VFCPNCGTQNPDTALTCTKCNFNLKGAAAPKFVELTNAVVFDDLWRRADLTARDRSLVTLAALAAMGDDEQLEPYLRRGLESGLSRAHIAEAMTHLGFYAGWAKATAALTAIARILDR
jgi:4-carboxymuconolactone decarboxylase